MPTDPPWFQNSGWLGVVAIVALAAALVQMLKNSVDIAKALRDMRKETKPTSAPSGSMSAPPSDAPSLLSSRAMEGDHRGLYNGALDRKVRTTRLWAIFAFLAGLALAGMGMSQSHRAGQAAGEAAVLRTELATQRTSLSDAESLVRTSQSMAASLRQQVADLEAKQATNAAAISRAQAARTQLSQIATYMSGRLASYFTDLANQGDTGNIHNAVTDLRSQANKINDIASTLP